MFTTHLWIFMVLLGMVYWLYRTISYNMCKTATGTESKTCRLLLAMCLLSHGHSYKNRSKSMYTSLYIHNQSISKHIKATKTRLSDWAIAAKAPLFSQRCPALPAPRGCFWIHLQRRQPEKWGKAGDNCRKTVGFYRDNDWKTMEHPDMNKSTICIHLHIVFLSNNVMILSNVAAAPCLQSIYEFLPMKRLFLYWFVWNYIGYRTSF